MDEKELRKRFVAVFDEHEIDTEPEFMKRLIAKLANTALEAISTAGAPAVQSKPTVGSRFPKTAEPAKPVAKKRSNEMPDELVHALECSPDHDFVQDCERQWEEKHFLSEKQLDALGAWKPRGEYD